MNIAFCPNMREAIKGKGVLTMIMGIRLFLWLFPEADLSTLKNYENAVLGSYFFLID